MKLNIYTIYDTASGLYSRPFFETADAAAIRQFQDIATGTEHPISVHPEDYSLFRLGTYDDATAKIQTENKDCLSTALELVAKSREVNRGRISEVDQAMADEVLDKIKPLGLTQ